MSMSWRRAGVFTVLLACAAAMPAAIPSAQTEIVASPWTEQHASRVRLLAGRARTANGHYLAGLQIVLADGWKTYWRMPGDSGVPPSFDWAGSGNVAAVNVLYPAPKRMPEAGGEAIGYKQAVLLPLEVTPEDPTKPIKLKLALEYGICREICIPATSNFELAIPSGPQGAPPGDIASALEQVPRAEQSRRKMDPELKRISVKQEASPRLTIEAVFPGSGKGADVFVEAPAGFYVPLPKRLPGEARGAVVFETDLGRDLAQDLKGKTLTVTLVSDAGASEARWTFP
jgi:DsbC/DsbD-like thiol-disulfide interchange protein